MVYDRATTLDIWLGISTNWHYMNSKGLRLRRTVFEANSLWMEHLSRTPRHRCAASRAPLFAPETLHTESAPLPSQAWTQDIASPPSHGFTVHAGRCLTQKPTVSPAKYQPIPHTPQHHRTSQLYPPLVQKTNQRALVKPRPHPRTQHKPVVSVDLHHATVHHDRQSETFNT